MYKYYVHFINKYKKTRNKMYIDIIHILYIKYMWMYIFYIQIYKAHNEIYKNIINILYINV